MNSGSIQEVKLAQFGDKLDTGVVRERSQNGLNLNFWFG